MSNARPSSRTRPNSGGSGPWAYSDLASQLVASGRTQEAKEVFRQAAARFSKTIELNGKTWWAWSSRGEAYAELGEWNKAEADFAKAVELAPEQVHLHYRRALAGLALVDTNRYHETCADMVIDFGHSPDLEAAYWSAWTCALAPDAVTDWQPVVRLAEKALTADPKNCNMINNLGAILYRSGRFKESAERLAEAEAAFQQTPGARSSIVHNWLFQAMAHHRLGHTVEAACWLKKSVQAIDEPSPKIAQAPATIPWNRRLTLQLLRREAEELLKNQSGVRKRGLREETRLKFDSPTEAAGEALPPSKPLTGPAPPRRSVCAGNDVSPFYRRPTLKGRTYHVIQQLAAEPPLRPRTGPGPTPSPATGLASSRDASAQPRSPGRPLPAQLQPRVELPRRRISSGRGDSRLQPRRPGSTLQSSTSSAAA